MWQNNLFSITIIIFFLNFVSLYNIDLSLKYGAAEVKCGLNRLHRNTDYCYRTLVLEPEIHLECL